MTNFEKDNQTGANHEGANVNWPVKFLTASSIEGDEVINGAGETLGKIKDVMLDVRKGTIEYYVIEFGGFLGFGEKLFAIPQAQLHVKPGKRAFILDKKKEDLEKAPGFDQGHWPETNSHHYSQVDSYWGSFMGVNTGGGPS
jgi:sporulation protein YlmC with PRC-barrel domain